MIAWRFHYLFVVLILLQTTVNGFVIGNRPQPLKSESALKDASDVVEISVGMPPSGSGLQANMKIQPILSVPSEFVEVRYKVPFGLNVAPKNQLCVCTKDGPGGEKEGDVLRYTSQWTLGFPSGDGLITSAASFSGGVSWQCSLFNVVKARSWDQVVEALTSNVETRTDEVVLIFERPLQPAPELA